MYTHLSLNDLHDLLHKELKAVMFWTHLQMDCLNDVQMDASGRKYSPTTNAQFMRYHVSAVTTATTHMVQHGIKADRVEDEITRRINGIRSSK